MQTLSGIEAFEELQKIKPKQGLSDLHLQSKEKLQQIFKNYSPEFYFLAMNEFYDAMDNFVKDYNIDMLVTVPRRHNNSNNLFRSTHTKRLAYHSNIPLMAAHE